MAKWPLQNRQDAMALCEAEGLELGKPQGDTKLGPVGKSHGPLHNLLLWTRVHNL